MLTNTFLHLPGVGQKREQQLWAGGLHSWGDALFDSKFPAAWRPLLEASLRHLKDRNPAFFAASLPSNQQWRLFRNFRDRCVFVDVETTGLAPGADITTIALFDGETLRTYIRGQNLEQFAQDIRAYHLLVTYNGKSFDVPILERSLGVKMPRAHIDLRYVLAGLGLKGGLKNVERRLGLVRPGLQEVDGYTAVLLWDEYQRRGNAKALQTLLAYNAHDVINLQTLVIHAHNEYLKQTPFISRHTLEKPNPVEVPFHPDPETVARVTRGRGMFWGC
jgi:uncharacterized protein YprB with RNaseH-like and TPR domain